MKIFTHSLVHSLAHSLTHAAAAEQQKYSNICFLVINQESVHDSQGAAAARPSGQETQPPRCLEFVVTLLVHAATERRRLRSLTLKGHFTPKYITGQF